LPNVVSIPSTFTFTLVAPAPGVSHFAHLGGMVAGFLYMRTGMMYKRGPGLASSLEQVYKDWKLRRAKKRFQVYLKKKDPGRDRWTN